MSEDELRIAGAEQAILALAPFLTDEGLREVRALLRADLAVATDLDEQVATKHALQLIADGACRFRLFNLGAWVQGS
jgi:hypothetical protein